MQPTSILKALAVSPLFLSSGLAAGCTREALLSAAQSYLAAQTAGKYTDLKLSPSNFTYRQNNKVTDISKSILTTAYKMDTSRTTVDTIECATYSMWISTSGSKPYVVGTQLRHANNDTTTISMIDTIAATTGDLFFDAKKTLGYIQKEDWSTINATASRPSRALLRKVGDAYLDMWTDAKAADSIPWGIDCERVEGSQYTNPCGKSLPRGGSSTNNGMRRYVIDESVGSVEIMCSFDSLGSLPDTHEIRVIDGKVRYVHTITTMH